MVSLQQAKYFVFTSELYQFVPETNDLKLFRKSQFLVRSKYETEAFEDVYHIFNECAVGLEFVITPTATVSKEFYDFHTELHICNAILSIFPRHI